MTASAVRRAIGGPVLEAAAAARAWRHGRTAAEGPAFVVFGRGRSGSTMLVDMLDQHPDVSCLGEILRYGALAPVSYIENRLSGLPGRVRGFKLLSYQLRRLSPAGQSNLRAWLIERGVRVLRLRREDLFAHAVSNIYAARRGAYHSTDRGAAVHRTIHVEPAELDRWMEGSRALLAFEEAFLHGIDRFEISYERDLEEPAARAGAFAAVTGFLGLPPAAFEVGLARVTPRDYRRLISNYDEIVGAADVVTGDRAGELG